MSKSIIARTPDTSAAPTPGAVRDVETIHVLCEHPGCDNYAEGHDVFAWDRDTLHVHSGPWETSPGNVDCYWDPELERWHASAFLDDASKPLTPDEVHAFTNAWDAAYAAAQQLNVGEVTC